MAILLNLVKMFTCGLTCVSDRQTMTYIAPQGSSCIDLVFVSRHHSHLVDVSVVGSLEKKHQHVTIIFKTVPDIANHRSKTDTPQFRGGNPYFFSENLSQSVSFIYASMYSENVHAIHIAMQFTKNRDIV